MAASHLISGLDLGSVADFSVLCTVERSPRFPPGTEPQKRPDRRRWRYAVRWLESWDLGTRYTDIVSDVRGRFDTDALRWTRLAADMTGVGVAVVDQIRAARVPARVTPVVITAGHRTTRDEKTGEAHVPKKELVSTLLVLLQAGLVKWADPKALPRDGDAGRFRQMLVKLEKELADFRVKLTRAANETFGGDKSQHDDVVLALMLACWLGEHAGGGDPSGASSGGGESVVGGAPDGVFATGRGV